MQFVSDPSIASKIRKMKQRVRWQDSLLVGAEIDQTCLVLDDDMAENPEFSFLVIGDSGTGHDRHQNPQRQIAELLQTERDRSQFILHTGDVVYQVGSSEYYPSNFIQPYREFLVGGEHPDDIAYDQMVFNFPFLPVLGNHDYYDLPLIYGLLAQLSWPVRRLLRSQIELDVAWHGSYQGDAYAKAFLDYLKSFETDAQLKQHLDQHYTATTATGRCLRYKPGKFTRLPNRYYMFRYGGIDFFALDSNTFNAPAPLPDNPAGEEQRRQLTQRLRELEEQKQELLEAARHLNPDNSEDAELLDDNQAKVEQIDEIQFDIEKKLKAEQNSEIDIEQLNWLEQRLIESWHTPEVRGRVVYFHHPPYVTEATKWDQAQTLAVRTNLRQVFDQVAQAVGKLAQNRGIVDLVLNGHAHCLEHLYTVDTDHADSNINWIVCGGSGHSLRRQRPEGAKLHERIDKYNLETPRLVANSKLYIGRHGHGNNKRRPYSGLRIDVRSSQPLQFFVQPLVAERFQGQWHYPQVPGFVIGCL